MKRLFPIETQFNTIAQELGVVNVGNTRTRVLRLCDGVVREDASFLTSEIERNPPPPPANTVVIVSVVPHAARVLLRAWADRRILTLDSANSPLTISYHPPESLGADRLANAVAGQARFGSPVIIVDCGTATTITVVDDHGTLVGGAIAAGLGTTASALAERAAQLMEVDFDTMPMPWGDSTESCLQLGLLEGHVGLIKHLVARAETGLERKPTVILTGGWSHRLAPLLPHYEHLPDLTIEGAYRYAALYFANP